MTANVYINRNARIVWQGPSLIDGQPIVVIATGFAIKSANRKTGDTIQTWILRADMTPVDAVKSGADSTICGNCIHRANEFGGRTCYVNVGQAPQSVWHSYAAGNIGPLQPEDLTGKPVRVGSYGDPAAVPAEVWRNLLHGVRFSLGYTHQWRNDFAQEHKQFCMASCDTEQDLAEARAAGWRAFVVIPQLALAPAGTIECRAIAINKQCDECRLCNGSQRANWPSIYIQAHGAAAAKYAAKVANREHAYHDYGQNGNVTWDFDVKLDFRAH